MNNNKETKPEGKELFTGGDWLMDKFFEGWQIQSDMGFVIADIPNKYRKSEENKANANLLIASKDMYYALKDAKWELESHWDAAEEGSTTSKLLVIINAALSKALGNK